MIVARALPPLARFRVCLSFNVCVCDPAVSAPSPFVAIPERPSLPFRSSSLSLPPIQEDSPATFPLHSENQTEEYDEVSREELIDRVIDLTNERDVSFMCVCLCERVHVCAYAQENGVPATSTDGCPVRAPLPHQVLRATLDKVTRHFAKGKKSPTLETPPVDSGLLLRLQQQMEELLHCKSVLEGHIMTLLREVAVCGDCVHARNVGAAGACTHCGGPLRYCVCVCVRTRPNGVDVCMPLPSLPAAAAVASPHTQRKLMTWRRVGRRVGRRGLWCFLPSPSPRHIV